LLGDNEPLGCIGEYYDNGGQVVGNTVSMNNHSSYTNYTNDAFTGIYVEMSQNCFITCNQTNYLNNHFLFTNSPERTVMYASFHKNVAVRETKPSKGERIIISTWENVSGMPFNSFPITNAALVPNEGVIKSTKAFHELCCLRHHPLIAEIMDCYLGFFAKEFVKAQSIKSTHRYEYLYCSYFADSILLPPSKRDGRPLISILLNIQVLLCSIKQIILLFYLKLQTVG
jgi:hypothetical protein